MRVQFLQDAPHKFHKIETNIFSEVSMNEQMYGEMLSVTERIEDELTLLLLEVIKQGVESGEFPPETNLSNYREILKKE